MKGNFINKLQRDTEYVSCGYGGIEYNSDCPEEKQQPKKSYFWHNLGCFILHLFFFSVAASLFICWIMGVFVEGKFYDHCWHDLVYGGWADRALAIFGGIVFTLLNILFTVVAVGLFWAIIYGFLCLFSGEEFSFYSSTELPEDDRSVATDDATSTIADLQKQILQLKRDNERLRTDNIILQSK